MIRSNCTRKTLIPKHIFQTSRATRRSVENVFLVLEQKGVLGYGEASPNSLFGEDPSDVHSKLSSLPDYFRRQTLDSVDDIARIWDELWPFLSPSRAGQCAVDLALWDLWSKLQGQSACETIWQAAPRPIASSATLGICPREEWDVRIAEAVEFPAIKVKMDDRADIDFIRAIREKSSAPIRVDANCAWSAMDIGALSRKLAELNVEFIEQPLPPAQNERMPDWLSKSVLPILADESCLGPSDIPKLAGSFSGFNIKLVKCGGITPAVRMIAAGRELGLQIMIGCMLESSLLISAGTVLAQKTDFADLDGAWLINNDPFDGLSIHQGRLSLGPNPGFGVEPIPYSDSVLATTDYIESR